MLLPTFHLPSAHPARTHAAADEGNFMETGDPNTGTHTPPPVTWPVWRAGGARALVVGEVPSGATTVRSSDDWDTACDAFWLPWRMDGCPLSPTAA